MLFVLCYKVDSKKGDAFVYFGCLLYNFFKRKLIVEKCRVLKNFYFTQYGDELISFKNRQIFKLKILDYINRVTFIA